MKKVQGQPYLYLHKCFYYFRIAVPRPLVGFFQKCEYKKSLGTQDFRRARSKCYCLSLAALSFFEEIGKLSMYLSEERIKEIVRNHFEKRLLDAAEEFFIDTLEAPNDPKSDYSPEYMAHLRNTSDANLEHYNSLRTTFEYDQEQEKIAAELLQVHNINKSNSYSQSNLRKLCSDLLRAHYEAERILNAYLKADEKNGNIQDPYFQGCKNFFEEPDPGLFFEYHGKPYVGKISSITLSDAFDQFYDSLKNEALQTGRKSVSYKKYNGFFDDLFEIWGRDKELSTVQYDDCLKLKEYLIKFPLDYKEKFQKKGINLLSILNGKNDDYPRIKANTAKLRWDAYKLFFNWAKEKKYVPHVFFNDIVFKGKRHKQEDRDPFSEKQLITLFSSPIYTGRKNAKKAFWIPAEAGDKKYIIRDGYFWLPLVALYTGMRMGEILYLTPDDVFYENGIYFFDLKGNKEALKTAESVRRIPFHTELINIGLVTFWQERKALVSKNDCVNPRLGVHV